MESPANTAYWACRPAARPGYPLQVLGPSCFRASGLSAAIPHAATGMGWRVGMDGCCNGLRVCRSCRFTSTVQVKMQPSSNWQQARQFWQYAVSDSLFFRSPFSFFGGRQFSFSYFLNQAYQVNINDIVPGTTI